MARQPPLRLFCSHGATLLFIARHPDCTITDLTDALVVTRRTVWGLISDLKRGNLVQVRKEGRRHHYTMNDDAPFPDPALSHLTIGQVFKSIAA